MTALPPPQPSPARRGGRERRDAARGEGHAAVRFDRRRLRQVLLVLVVSVSLHVVPQWLAAWFDPALTMIALMVLDAVVFAAVARSTGGWRVALLLAFVFAFVYASRQQQFVAAPSVVLNLLLAAAFGFTLRDGAMPLISRIAVHSFGLEILTAPFAGYMRALTGVWALFFVAMAAASLVLALAAPFAWWSLFANVLSWPLVGVMFVGEWAFRRVFHPHLPAHTPLQIIASALAFPGAR